MNNKLSPLFILTIFLTMQPSSAQKIQKAQKLSKYHIPAANYSGITHLWRETFAVCDDKSFSDGYYLFTIQQDPHNGKILHVHSSSLLCDGAKSNSDTEDIAFQPSDSSLFITSEADHQIRQYNLQGIHTGKKLAIPSYFSRDSIQHNGSFEALAFDTLTHLFWTTTEVPLRCDPPLMVRLQAFNRQLQPTEWYAYQMDSPEFKEGKYYAHGIPAILPWGDERLLVMERELTVPKGYIGAKCRIKLYLTSLHCPFCTKQLLTSFTTHIKPFLFNYANYEGISWGRTLEDGRRTLILISDSQAGAGNKFYHLKDYLRVIVLQR